MSAFWRTRSGRRSSLSAARSGSRCGHAIRSGRSKSALAVLAIEQVAHDAAALGVGLGSGLTLEAVGAFGRGGLGFGFRGAAGWAAVGVAGLVRAQFELLSAEDTGFDGESHGEILIANRPMLKWLTPAAGCGMRVSRLGVWVMAEPVRSAR